MHTSGSGPGVQSKDSFESVGSAGTPDADVIHQSDLSNVKLKGVDAESNKRAHRKGSSVSSGSSAAGGRHRSSDRQHHYQNADQQNRNVHKGSPAAAATPKGAHSKRKGAPHALPSSKKTDAEEEEEEDVLMSPEHEYEDIPDQSDDETKEDRWNEDRRQMTQDKDELDDDHQKMVRTRTADNDGDDEDEEEDESLNVGTTNSNDTRTLTQQCSLVAPNEVHITESPSLIAEPVLSESGKDEVKGGQLIPIAHCLF